MNASPPGRLISAHSSFTENLIPWPKTQIHSNFHSQTEIKEVPKMYSDEELTSLAKNERMQLAQLFDLMNPPAHDPLLMMLYHKVRESSELAHQLAIHIERIYSQTTNPERKDSLADELKRYKTTFDERGVIYHLILNAPSDFTKFYGIKLN